MPDYSDYEESNWSFSPPRHFQPQNYSAIIPPQVAQSAKKPKSQVPLVTDYNSDESFIANVKSVSVILDPNDERTKQTIYFSDNENFFRPISQKEKLIGSKRDAMKDSLQRHLAQKAASFVTKDLRKMVKIDQQSTPEEVKTFLTNREFSEKFKMKSVIVMFGDLTGAQIFKLYKEEFEKFCGKEEGSKLHGLILMQKSICGYDESSELKNVLKSQKKK